jgi:peptidoglycan/xylan/chitin deacetylase (PgdA/CDA1 family)
MQKKVKQFALSACKSAGLFSLVRDCRWRSRRLLILCYHGISLEDEHEWNPALYMSPTDFRERMALLRRNGYRVLPLGEALYLLASKALPPRSVVITFDDGFHDFLECAFPILQEFGFPATVYLATYYSRYNRPVFDVICPYLLWKGRGMRVDGKGIAAGIDTTLDLRTASSRNAAWSDIYTFAIGGALSAEEKNDVAATLAKRVHVDYDAILAKRVLHLMTPEEVQYVRGSGVDIQLHTHRHRTPSDRTLFLNEIADNRRDILAMTRSATAPTHFCYPSGVYRPAFLPWLEEAGVTSAVTCELGMASRNSTPLLLPRLLDSESIPVIEFEAWLSGVASLLPRGPAQAWRNGAIG